MRLRQRDAGPGEVIEASIEVDSSGQHPPRVTSAAGEELGTIDDVLRGCQIVDCSDDEGRMINTALEMERLAAFSDHLNRQMQDAEGALLRARMEGEDSAVQSPQPASESKDRPPSPESSGNARSEPSTGLGQTPSVARRSSGAC
jgi:hypothetical protein